MGEFLDCEKWDFDDPGTELKIKFTWQQWNYVKYLAYMAFEEESNNCTITQAEAIDKFIKILIENELLDPKLQGPKLKQQSLFDKND